MNIFLNPFKKSVLVFLIKDFSSQTTFIELDGAKKNLLRYQEKSDTEFKKTNITIGLKFKLPLVYPWCLSCRGLRY